MAEISQRCSAQKWKPTEEQLQILEGLYINVFSKPTAEQIYHIADLLKSYGDLQAKNVYYWFHNRRGTDRNKKRGRLEERMASVMFKAAKIRAELRIGRCWEKMESSNVNETYKVLTASKLENSCIDEETTLKEKWCTGGKKKANPGDDYKHEDIQLTPCANKMFRNRGWALSRIDRNRLPKYRELQERKDRNKPLQSLQLFPLEPSTTKHRDDNLLESNYSVI